MAGLPDQMDAIDPTEAGGPEVLELVRRPVPRPGSGEVLIKVEAAGVNRPDILQQRGLYPPLEPRAANRLVCAEGRPTRHAADRVPVPGWATASRCFLRASGCVKSDGLTP